MRRTGAVLRDARKTGTGLIVPFVLVTVLFVFSSALPAAQMQGVIVDWNCVKAMVKNGREKTLKQNQSCSMMKNYSRAAYGLITDDRQHYYKLDDAGRAWALRLLKDTPDKDNLKVIVDGAIEGDTLHVTNMSEL